MGVLKHDKETSIWAWVYVGDSWVDFDFVVL